MLMLGFYGHSNSGKTTLIEKLVAKYEKRGLTVAVLKHTAHRGFELDSEGTDSWRHAKAGAAAVALLADGRAAVLLHRMTAGNAAAIADEKGLPADAALLVSLVREAVQPDILFLEGFKHAGLEKVACGDIAELPGTVFRADPKNARGRRALERFVKKSAARKIIYGAFDIIEGKIKKPGLEVFKQASSNVQPIIEVRSRRVGGATYQVPSEVRPERRTALAMRWIKTYASQRGDKTMSQKLAQELIAASNNEGSAVKKKDDTHKMAEANKAFAHFKW